MTGRIATPVDGSCRINSMPFRFHHLHLKARDPEETAAWYERAFDFRVIETVRRPAGDLVVTAKIKDGTTVLISGEKPGQTLERGNSRLHLGLEHFALVSEAFDRDIEHLKSIGVPFLQEPVTVSGGVRFAYIEGPDDVRIELIHLPNA